jgi:hypothetical protein
MAMVPKYTSRASVPGRTGMQTIPLSLATSPLSGAGEGLTQIAKVSENYADIKKKREEDAELLEVKKALATGREQNTLYMLETPMESGGAGFSDGVKAQIDTWGANTAQNFKTKIAQDAFNLGWNGLRSDLSIRASVMQTKAYDKYRTQSITETIAADSSTVRIDPTQLDPVLKERIKQIEKMTLDQDLKDKMIFSAKNRLGLSAIQGIISSNPAEGKKQLEAGKWNNFVTGKQMDALLKSADTGINKEKAEATIVQSMAYSDLVIKFLNGGGTREEIDLFRQNARADVSVTGKQLITLERLFLKDQSESEKRAAQMEYGQQAFLGTISLNPDDKTARDAVNAHYSAVVRAVPPEKFVDFSVNYVERTGVVPATLRSNIVAGLNSVDSAKIIPAAMVLEKLSRATNTKALQQFPNKSISYAQQVLDYNRMGLSAEESVKKANDMRNILPAEKDNRTRAFREIEKETPPTDVIQGFVDEGWFEASTFSTQSDPVINEVMAGEFSRLREREYVLSGDDETAQKAAFTMMRKNWGVTNINGDRRFMKYAPESIYGQPNLSEGENTEWIQKQLFSDVTKDSIYTEDFTSNLILAVNPRVKTKDGLPVYSVLHRDPATGIIQNLERFNAWVPDYSVTPEFKKLNDENAQRIDDAKENAKKLREQQRLSQQMRSGEIPQKYYGPEPIPTLGGR